MIRKDFDFLLILLILFKMIQKIMTTLLIEA